MSRRRTGFLAFVVAIALVGMVARHGGPEVRKCPHKMIYHALPLKLAAVHNASATQLASGVSNNAVGQPCGLLRCALQSGPFLLPQHLGRYDGRPKVSSLRPMAVH